MGARSNIELKYEKGQPSVFIYSHWDSDKELQAKLRIALARKQRWDDAPYLSRIIFCAVLDGDINGETGYGLSPYPGEEGYPTTVVDLDAQTVNGASFADFVK